MPKGKAHHYTSKQHRMERHIEQGYEKREGMPKKKAESIAWATVNKKSKKG